MQTDLLVKVHRDQEVSSAVFNISLVLLEAFVHIHFVASRSCCDHKVDLKAGIRKHQNISGGYHNNKLFSMQVSDHQERYCCLPS